MPRAPYKDNSQDRKLLLAFDVGTTFSGISYSILDPDRVPEILEVTAFPGQKSVQQNSKIPSVIYYGKGGEVKAIGAETEREDIEIIAEEEEWIRAEWFKLHLDPSLKKKLPSDSDIPHLPLTKIGKSALEIFADFLKYLNDSAKQHIEERHPGIGTNVWEKGDIHYVLSHPNGWEGKQQSLLRQAAEKAGLITKESGDGRKVTFITEGEASLDCCIEKADSVADALISNGEGVVIVDAGGGTIDFSAYACKSDGKKYEEIAESQCHIKGSIFVTQEHAKKHFEERLKGTPYVDDIPQMLPDFDRSAKCQFRSADSPHFVPLASRPRKLQDTKLGIRSGRLRIDGNVMASFFEPSINCITTSVLSQVKIAHKKITNVFLVGGFSANDYLFQRVKEELEKHDLKVYRPDGQLNKAVSQGAVIGALDHPVSSRVTRYAYGIRCAETYDSSNLDHFRRKSECLDSPITGERMLRVFDTIIPRNTQVSETQEFRRTYCQIEHFFMHVLRSELAASRYMEIICYEGDLKPSEYKYINEHSKFREVFKVKLDTSELPTGMCVGPEGPFFMSQCDVVLNLGLTEFRAQIAWEKDGVEHRGDAEITYDTDL